MSQGIHNYTAEQYHADPAPTASLSSSIANILLNQSPQNAWLAHPRLNTRYVREDANSRFDLGSAAHLMLLERREDKIVRVQADDWRTKAAKEQRDAANFNGQYAILEHHYLSVVDMATVARDFIDCTELRGILDTGDTERTVLWQENDLWYRCRPDVMSADRRVIMDYKTTASANPIAFAKQIGRMNYDLQASFYTRGIQAVTGREDCEFVFLAQEIEAPYACSLIGLSAAYRSVGDKKAASAIKTWDSCVKKNDWRGYTNQICYAEPKPWDLAEAESMDDKQEILES